MKKEEAKEIKKLIEKVDGWLTDEEGELLYGLARNCKGNGVIVEIGSWKGKSTIWLGKGAEAGNKVRIYAIDPHTGSSEHKEMYRKVWTFEEFKKNIRNARIDDIVTPIVKKSEEASEDFDEPIELIFIDGAHEYDSVKLDFDLWFPKVIDGGIIAFHDTVGWPGPEKVVEKFVYKSKNFKNVGFVGSITFAEKVKRNSMKDRLRNRYVLLLKSVSHKTYKCAGKNVLPEPIRVIGRKLIRFAQ